MYTYVLYLDDCKFMPTKLLSFHIPRPSIKEPVPREQNQDEPSVFPKEILEKKNLSLPTCQSGTLGQELSSKTQYLYYKANTFQHFDYIYKLTRECKLRNFGEKHHPCSSLEITPMPRDVIFKIGIVGAFTEENLRLIAKRKGKRKTSKNQTVWKVTPLLCFQNDLDLKSAKELLRGQDTSDKASDKILIKSASICDETEETTESLIIIAENKTNIARAITSCLEKPIHQILQHWSTGLKTEGLGKRTSRVIAEIKAIRKELVLDEHKRTTAATDCKTCVPDDLKDYLFGRPDVNAFGIWSNSLFKIYVEITTNGRELKSKLTKRYRHFFDNYPLDIEIGKFIEHPIIKQGDPIFAGRGSKYSPKGTLGGFVINENEERKKYALTCNHIFPSRNQIEYADSYDDGVRKEIGSCVFRTTDKSCDFAAIEINDTCLDNCNVTFKRDDGKDINAHLNNDSLENFRVVHKIGATTGVTQGYILSSEFYNKSIEKGNRECIFLVKGTGRTFSEEGDSGSLVFCRPRNIQQNYVDIVGMVYAKNCKAKVEIDIYKRTDKESELNFIHGNQNISTEMKNTHVKNQQTFTPSLSREDDRKKAAEDDQDADELSCCYRLHTALELFKEDQGPNFNVKFKDDLSSSSPSTSESDEEAV